VETDGKKRITRIAQLRNGQKISEEFYRFAANAKLPSEYESFTAGEKTGVSRIQRDSAGNRVREDNFTAGGTLTGYEVYSYSPDHVEEIDYTSDGKKDGYSIFYYSSNGTLVRRIRHPPADPPMYLDTQVDEGTGLRKSLQQFNDGKLNNTVSFAYNADSDLVRQDFYDADHKWLGADEFSDNLKTKRIYKAEEGGTKELRYTYDEKRWYKESALYYKGVFVCKLLYDRLPDGTAKRTLALGPNGELWAEYPDAQVIDVTQNGNDAIGRKSVIHKTGNWW
jgi:hypothetical protein